MSTEEAPALELRMAPPRLGLLSRSKLLDLVLPLAFAAAVLITSLPEAIDVYRLENPGGDFNYLINAGRVAGSDNAARLYDYTVDQRRWLLEKGYEFPIWYPYPPLTALLTAPFGGLSDQDAFVLWKLAILAGGVLIAVTAALAFKSWPWRIAVVVALACWQPLLLNVRIGQTGVFVAGLIAAGLLVFMRNRKLGAVVLGLLGLKPSLAVVGFIAVVPHGWRTWVTFTLVTLAVIFGPFVWLGTDALFDWKQIMTDRSATDLSGGHAYNYGLTRILNLEAKTVYFLLPVGLLTVVLLTQRIYNRLGLEASLAFALYCGLLVNPHSMLYDWPAAFAGLILIRRAGGLGPLSQEGGVGLLAIALFFMGQISWSETYRDTPFRPLTLWAAFVVGWLTISAFAPAAGWRLDVLRPARLFGPREQA